MYKLNASKLAILSAVCVLIGAGCAPVNPPTSLSPETQAMVKSEEKESGDAAMMGEEPVPNEAMMEEKKPDSNGAMMKEERKPYYATYSAAQSAQAQEEGRAIVYYFWASWCPICQAEEPKVKSWIEQSNLPVAGFRVNYDTEAMLKKKYKIPYQHTTVFLNGKGEEVERFNGPVEEAVFQAALVKATQ
jgi:thiol-disulfide isomerase/thioredoxin